MTPIENRAAWLTHWRAVDAAKAAGYCGRCAQQIGFFATDADNGIDRDVNLCGKCRRDEFNQQKGSR